MNSAPSIHHQTRMVPRSSEENIGLRAEAYSGDSTLVCWDGLDDPENPKNWPYWRRWLLTYLLSFGGLVTLPSSSMMAPAMKAIASSMHATEEEITLALTIFILAFAFGPLVLGPCSEIFGRVPVWLLSSVWYITWSLGCGMAKTKGVMILARFMTGLGASAEFAIMSPVVSDIWHPEERGKAIALAFLTPFLGVAIGPILGGVLTDAVGWPWLFYLLSIFDAVLVILTILLFRETHGPTILRRRAKRLTLSTGRQHHTEFDVDRATPFQRLKTGMARPYWLFITHPILPVMSIFLAFNFGMLYIVLALFASVWIEEYHESARSSGFHYVSIVVGYIIASQLGGPAMDRVWAHLKAKHNEATAPEYRVPLMPPSMVLIPAGILWYGWSIEAHTHWAVVDVGVGVFGCGIILGTMMMQAYVMDAFPEHVASATAASQFLRYIFAFALPIFAPSMYTSLGYGWGNSLLACIFLIFGVPAPFVLWKWGAKLREIGKMRQHL